MRNFLKASFLVSILVWLAGCEGLKTRSEIDAGKNTGRSAPVGRNGSPSQQESAPVPPPVQVKMPKVGLVLGPGGAKSYAHVGVIKELEKAKIPIHAVVGLEWGSIVGGIYSINGSVNDLEWKLFKLDHKELTSRGLFGGGGGASLQVLKKFIADNLGSVSLSRTKARFACPSMSLRGGVLVWQDSGSLSTAIENCLPFPPNIKLDRGNVASAFSVAEAIEKVRSMGAELVIVVDVLDRGDLVKKEDPTANLFWAEVRNKMRREERGANEVITVSTREATVDDFDKQRELIQNGQQAGENAAKRISDRYGF